MESEPTRPPRMDRQVCASAPGKIILIGEHAVVHGAKSIATSINKRTAVIWRPYDRINPTFIWPPPLTPTMTAPEYPLAEDADMDAAPSGERDSGDSSCSSPAPSEMTAQREPRGVGGLQQRSDSVSLVLENLGVYIHIPCSMLPPSPGARGVALFPRGAEAAGGGGGGGNEAGLVERRVEGKPDWEGQPLKPELAQTMASEDADAAFASFHERQGLEAVQHVVESAARNWANGATEGEDVKLVVKRVGTAASAFYFLYWSLLRGQPGSLYVKSELPMGAGLGSSGAYCVAVAAALAKAAGMLSLRSYRSLSEPEANFVNVWAYHAEKLIHGKPSGVDNTVSCYGGHIGFQRGRISRIHGHRSERLLLTDTLVTRDTKVLVAAVAERVHALPNIYTKIFETIHAVAEEFELLLTNHAKKTPKFDESTRFTQMQELFRLNQHLLEALGVSHPAIARVCEIARGHGLAAKLTGAGGGGCVITLIPPGWGEKNLQAIVAALKVAGYPSFFVTAGGEGARFEVEASSEGVPY